MPAKTRESVSADLKRFLRKHAKTEAMELLVPDMHGILRSKRIRRRDFEKYCADGFFFCGGAVLLDTLGQTIPGMPYGEYDGDPDVDARLVAGSFAPVPWSARPQAQALFRLYDEDGAFFGDPRTVLEHALKPFRHRSIRIVMATELEFYLLDGDAERPTPKGSMVPGTTRPQPGAQVYHPDDLHDIEPFIDDVYAWCDAQDIPAEAAISEYSQGQFEINLKHVDDPVLACDHAVLLKRVIKAAARRHGFIACFMAKPFAEDSGSGLHIHMSLYGKDGKNYFSRDRDSLATPPFSARLKYAVGGLLALMPESTALFAPNMNSYRRMRADMFAPVDTNWGVNHRAVAVRIPASDAKNTRFEHRVAGADANPYLVTAAVLAGVDHGIRQKIEPPRMVEQGEVIEPKLRIPNRWDAALECFEKSKVLPEYLGGRYCKFFVANRRDECERFHNAVSQLDFDWYLRSV